MDANPILQNLFQTNIPGSEHIGDLEQRFHYDDLYHFKDFNGDGRKDILGSSISVNRLSIGSEIEIHYQIFVNFGYETKIISSYKTSWPSGNSIGYEGADVYYIDVEDVNGDGSLDLETSHKSFVGGEFYRDIWLNDGSGQFKLFLPDSLPEEFSSDFFFLSGGAYLNRRRLPRA